MFDHEEIPELCEKIRVSTARDSRLLEELCADMRTLKSSVRVIKPRSATAVSLVASDSANNKLQFDPFLVQIVRVVDSYGKRLCLDVISPTTDTDILAAQQFDADGSPKTALGRMMFDLNVRTLHDLSPMIPKGELTREDPDRVKPGWVVTYRDLCEWATLYERICYRSFATDTLLVRDGLLRAKFFSRKLFSNLAKLIQTKMEEVRANERREIFLVGLAKRSQLIDRYRLAMSIEELFPAGEARFVRVPRKIEEKVYAWSEYARGMEAIGEEGEEPKFAAGTMHLVRFGAHQADRIWPVDVFEPEADRSAEIFGYLLGDATDGFPVPHYPRCLQKAHEWAEVEDFDAEIMQRAVLDAVRDLLPDNKRGVIDAQNIIDIAVSERRYT